MNPMQKLILLFVAALVCGVMTACGPDLLELDPQEPSDLTVAQLVAKMNHASDPKGNYRDAKTYMMKQDLSSVKPGKKEYYATEIQFKAPRQDADNDLPGRKSDRRRDLQRRAGLERGSAEKQKRETETGTAAFTGAHFYADGDSRSEYHENLQACHD